MLGTVFQVSQSLSSPRNLPHLDRPPDIQAQEKWDTVDVPRLIRILAVSEKYVFPIHRDWALDILNNLATTDISAFIEKCGPWGNLGRMLELAQQCHRKGLVDCIEEAWLGCISALVDGQRRLDALNAALDVAERSNCLRSFHGWAYYNYLISTGVFSARSPDSTLNLLNSWDDTSYLDQSLSTFTQERRLRILNGFWSLSRLRLKLMRPPQLPDSPSCLYHTKTCLPAWKEWWKDLVSETFRNKNCFNDPGFIIRSAREKVASPILFHVGLEEYTIPCDAAIRSQVKVISDTFDNNLASHFMIP